MKAPSERHAAALNPLKGEAVAKGHRGARTGNGVYDDSYCPHRLCQENIRVGFHVAAKERSLWKFT